VLGTQTDPKIPGHARRRADRRHVPRDGAAGHAAAERREVAEADGTIGIVNYKKDGGGPGRRWRARRSREGHPRRAAAGLELRKRENFLRYQYLLTFGVAPK
jgi:hypothetical protein